MERLFLFLRRFLDREFYGRITISCEHGKVTHVKVETERVYEYKDLESAECHGNDKKRSL